MWVDGRDTKNPDELWNVRQSAGMVFQNPDNQIIGTVVEEDVGFGPENLGVPTDEIWTRVEESLKAVGMIEYRSHSPKETVRRTETAGGDRRCYFVMNPNVSCWTEPTAIVLLPNGRNKC